MATLTISEATLTAAAWQCEDTAMRFRFSHDKEMVEASLAIEAFLSANGPSIFQLTGRARNQLLQECKTHVVGGLEALGVWSRPNSDVIEWLTQRSPVDDPNAIVISDVIPFTFGFLFNEWLLESLRQSNVASIELLLNSPTFLDLFSDSDRVATLAHAVQYAAASGNRDAINVLVAHGANAELEIEVYDLHSIEGLKYLVENGKTMIGDARVLKQAVCCSPAGDGTSRVDTVQWLLGLGVDVNVPGTTALHMAAERQVHPELVGVLVRYGFANIDARGACDQTPLMRAVATSENHLHSFGFCDQPFPLQVWTTIQLLTLGANPNAQDIEGKTALLLAPLHFSYDVLSELLKHGADPNIADRDGRTPLHRVREAHGMVDRLVKLLILHGADVHARMTDGRTPLHTLVASDDWFHDTELFHAVWWTMKRGADPNAVDTSGASPMSICLERQMVHDETLLRILSNTYDEDND